MTTMRAWIMEGYDGVAGLKLRTDVGVPEPGPGDVLVRVQFAALNPADRYLAERLYPARPKFPHILGRDGCGVVEAAGPGVTGVKPGDEVVILRGDAGVEEWGTLAEFVRIPAARIVPRPAGWSAEQSAAASLVYQTAHMALTQWGELPAGSWVLVTGASGGVGVASIHLASARGWRVIALSRGTSKVAGLKAEGAECVVDSTDREWHKQVRSVTGGDGVALAVDNIGGEDFNRLLDTMGMWGRISVVGMLAGPVPSFNTARLFFKRLRIGGVAVSSYDDAESRASWAEVVETLARSGRTPVIDSVFAFDALADAFERLRQGPLGKVLVRVA